VAFLYKKFVSETIPLQFLVTKDTRDRLQVEIAKVMINLEKNELNACHPTGRLMVLKQRDFTHIQPIVPMPS
jgi:hypothetical protein